MLVPRSATLLLVADLPNDGCVSEPDVSNGTVITLAVRADGGGRCEIKAGGATIAASRSEGYQSVSCRGTVP